MVPLLCCYPFHQGVQLSANLIDALTQLPMARSLRVGVTLFGEVLPVVFCDFRKLLLEGFTRLVRFS